MIAGIWDCLSAQDVVNFVRYQVSEGKELTEIGEMMCDYCLAPDAGDDGPDIGCDNMTVLMVAITHGRSKKEWYTWIADRVKNNYGYDTPKHLPQLYPQSRIDAFRRKKEIHDRRLKEKEAQNNVSTSAQSAPSPTPSHSQNSSSTGSESRDEPKSNTIWGAFAWQRGWTSFLFRLFAVVSEWFGGKRKNT